ncbi:MAG: ABC transporter ATP-binding protein, partial [Bacteroidetes bacterium]|nr:ABC transporter ATP-binding protein [Bacteroidota bacterium]
MAPKKERKVTIRQVFSTIIWPRKKQLFMGLVLIIISRIASLVLPGATKFLIDEVIPSNDLQQLKWLISAVVLAIFIQAVTSYALTQILSVEAQHLISKLRSKVQQHIIKLPIRFFDNSKTGELVSRIMTDVEGVRNLVGTGFAQMIGGGLAAIISLV